MRRIALVWLLMLGCSSDREKAAERGPPVDNEPAVAVADTSSVPTVKMDVVSSTPIDPVLSRFGMLWPCPFAADACAASCTAVIGALYDEGGQCIRSKLVGCEPPVTTTNGGTFVGRACFMREDGFVIGASGELVPRLGPEWRECSSSETKSLESSPPSGCPRF